MDSQKLANWAQIIGTLIAAALLGYVVWDHWPTPNPPSVVVEWGGIMKGYVPPAVIALLLLASSTLQFILWRRRQAKRSNGGKPTLEILSPFDNDEVGLFETVRGRVFPADSHLQVFVFAGDKKWYPQRHLAVNGTKWSVRCQFGNADIPRAGFYKIAAVLGAELNEAMWYVDLPPGKRSNVITVHRPEITIEQKLSRAVKERDEYKHEVESLTQKRDTLKESFDISRAEVGDFRDKLIRAEETHKREIDTKEDELKAAKDVAREADKRANEEKGNKDSIYAMFQEKENRLNELDWLIRLAGKQAQQLSDYVSVEIMTDQCGELKLSGDDLRVLLTVWIRNHSIFEIMIDEKKISGQFSLNRVAFKEKAEQLITDFHPPLHNLRHRQREYIIIEQPLRTFEAEKIQRCLDDPDAKFWIGGVRIPIFANNPGFEVKNEPCILWGKGAEVPLKYFKRNTNNA
jgi:hypothetical protein